jgi:predicted RNA-binding Zn ribbon-like protein
MYASVEELSLVGGHPALDLVNTMEPRALLPGCRQHDHLVDASALLTWATRAGLVSQAEAEGVAGVWAGDAAASQRVLHAVREVREALYAVLLAATGMLPPDALSAQTGLERLHLRWVAAMGRSMLVTAADGPTAARLSVGTAPALLVTDRAAHAAVELLRTVDPARLRACPADAGGCGWMFADRSRNRSRRWCQMADCGTQVKAKRLTERRRAARRDTRAPRAGDRRGHPTIASSNS